MTPRRQLAKDALMKALRLRRGNGLSPEAPVCVYDLANDLGVEVRFMDLPSLEGVYSKWPEPVIVISSLRPSGRQAYTSGHELGHHVYGHGFRIDELLADDEAKSVLDDEEFLADCFAGFLLMPKGAVVKAFACRGWNPASSTPVQVYTVAGWLGVGYETLITHMRVSLGLLNYTQAKSLRKTSPKEIKTRLLGMACQENLVVVDPWWSERAIDLEVGDFVLGMPGAISEKPCIRPVRGDGDGTILQAVAPGLGRICQHDSGWSGFVRVSRRGYVGRGIFRHEEEVGDEHSPSVCQ
jgi:hypothetical protein